MANTEATRPAFWVQLTAVSDWLLAASQTQKQLQPQNQTHLNRAALISAAGRHSAANQRLAGNEVRA